MNKANFNYYYSMCTNNREALLKSKECVCLFCKRRFNPLTIYEWQDNDTTGCCPHCEIDAVIAETDDVKLSAELVEQLNSILFGKGGN